MRGACAEGHDNPAALALGEVRGVGPALLLEALRQLCICGERVKLVDVHRQVCKERLTGSAVYGPAGRRGARQFAVSSGFCPEVPRARSGFCPCCCGVCGRDVSSRLKDTPLDDLGVGESCPLADDQQLLLVWRKGPQTGIVNRRHARVLPQHVRDFLCVGLCALYSESHGFDASKHEPAVKRCESRALGVLIEGDTLGKGLTSAAHDTSHGVRVPSEELCGGVDNNVCAKRDALHENGRHHGGINGKQHASFAAYGCKGTNVTDHHERIRWAFQVNHLGVVVDGCPHRLWIRYVYLFHGNAMHAGHTRDEAVHTAVNVGSDEQLVSRCQEPSHGVEGCHPRRKGKCCMRALEHCDVLL